MTDADVREAEGIGFEMGTCLARIERDAKLESLTRAMISTAIANVKPRLLECGEKSTAKGRVKVKVVVDSDGAVTSVTVETTPDAQLGECVAAAVRAATFEQTKLGGSFSYPFVF